MWWSIGRCLLLALNFSLLSSQSYPAATVVLTLLNTAIIWSWHRATLDAGRQAPRHPRTAIAVAAIATLLVLVAVRSWLREILILPHDPQRADMLIVIQLGIRRLLQGSNPYTMYQVPWPAPLPYGIVMWAPMLVPHLLHADIRLATIAGASFIPIACAAAAAVDAWRGRSVLAGSWLIVLAAIAYNSAIRGFMSIGHTPAYWPLLAAFAWLVGRRHWYGAALACGLLIAARTTMVSVAPVLLMAVWHRARPQTTATAAIAGSAAALPFLPFAISDWTAVRYALYDSYQATMKGFVWTSTNWAQHTIGVTGRLLEHGWQRAVEPVQILLMLALYAAAWIAIRRGQHALPWLAAALLVFSMSTLWPVIYLYFDVFLLLVCGALSDEPIIQEGHIGRTWIGVLLVSATVVVATALAMMRADVSIDAGSRADRRFLYAGFSNDEGDANLNFAWIVGTRAEVLVPRRSRADATVDITVEPNLPTAAATQQMSVALNGTVLGTATLQSGWHAVSFPAPSRAWQIGVNEVTLFLSSAVSPFEAGAGADRRQLSAAIDRLNIRTR